MSKMPPKITRDLLAAKRRADADNPRAAQQRRRVAPRPLARGLSLISVFCFVGIVVLGILCVFCVDGYLGELEELEKLRKTNAELTAEHAKLAGQQARTEEFVLRLKTKDEFKTRMIRQKLNRATRGEILLDVR